MGNFLIINKTKIKIPTLALPILKIKNDILGKDYCLSLAFIESKESWAINKKYRRKNKPTNILSFPLSKNSGEILLCPEVIKGEIKKFYMTEVKELKMNFREFLGFLVIHGMLHLKGIEHSSTMEVEENKYYEKYFCRNRHRIQPYTNSSRGIFQGRKKS